MNRKPIFDAVRRLLGRSFRTAEVTALDQATDRAIGQTTDQAPPAKTARRIGPNGVSLIKRFEGCSKRRADGLFEAYPDPGTGGDPWTIGWGATGPGIAPGTVWSQAQCDARLEADLVRYSAEVARALGEAPTSQQQFDALVSFHYNTGAIARATLTRLHRGGDFIGAAGEFGKWVHAGGRRLSGLVRRRTAEAALYRGD
ncbi:lysozyme [Novosphingobium ginsenosidimutans]|uniref:Lysozyme n=1 Tax=Novosphingobium ginsenosidimutans TaxID=1176536 RepID=A0A5B8S1H2_9SPHN|nr:lysozyme [Novosphingobium ginsenosidimutans]QEA14912.1 lysozyme [Novosphingobium ginsenosidimutans]